VRPIERKFLYWLPFFSVCLEVVRSFVGDEVPLLGARNYAYLAVLVVLYLRHVRRTLPVAPLIFLLSGYLLILVFESSTNLPLSLATYAVFICSLLMFPLGYASVRGLSIDRSLHWASLATLAVFSLSIIVFSLLGIGELQYEGASTLFRMGYFRWSNIYIGSTLLVVAPLIYRALQGRFSRVLFLILAAGTFIILVLSVRRTAVAIPVVGALVYLAATRVKFVTVLKRAAAIAVLLVLSYPLYGDILSRQIQARSYLFDTDRDISESYERETRFIEVAIVWNERIRTSDLDLQLFGDELFNSPWNYGGGLYRERPLHLDLTVMLHGSGIVGLLLFLLFHVDIFRRYLRLHWLTRKIQFADRRHLSGVFLGLFLTILILFVSGSFQAFSFRLILFLYLGVILGVYHQNLQNLRRGRVGPRFKEMETKG